MSLQDHLLKRAENKCELCQFAADLTLFEVSHAPHHDEDGCLIVCAKCLSQIDKKEELDRSHWSCLSTSMWSEVPAIQVVSWRMLNRLREESWAADSLDMMYMDDCHPHPICTQAKCGLTGIRTAGRLLPWANLPAHQSLHRSVE